jgi:hypothetical protein
MYPPRHQEHLKFKYVYSFLILQTGTYGNGGLLKASLAAEQQEQYAERAWSFVLFSLFFAILSGAALFVARRKQRYS